MATYDLMESLRNSNQWLGATARAWGAYPVMSMFANPAVEMVKAWGEVTERAFSRMVVKPDWGIPTVTAEDGKDHTVRIMRVVEKPFGDLIHFKVPGREARKRRVMIVAPMSGHYATLTRKTVISLLPDCEVFVTDWHNARDIPVSAGKFDVEDYTLYLVEFMKALGPDLHVIAICQPAPLTLAATAYLAEDQPEAQPRTLTLIGGPIDPDANATEVTDFGNRVTMGQLEQLMIQQVGFKYAGVGRLVYPGLLQLSSFITMNMKNHAGAFRDQIFRVARGQASDHDKHNEFYDEYLAVMDMTAEFYLSTVERIFKNREIATNSFVVAGRKVDIGAITTVAVKTVEGEEDDISAPGQCRAALDLLTGLPPEKKAWHLERGAGHYGIFAGKSWRNNIRPLFLRFIDANAAAEAKPTRAPAHRPMPRAAAPEAAAPVAAAPVAAAPVAAAPVAADPVADTAAAPEPAATVTADPVAPDTMTAAPATGPAAMPEPAPGAVPDTAPDAAPASAPPAQTAATAAPTSARRPPRPRIVSG